MKSIFLITLIGLLSLGLNGTESKGAQPNVVNNQLPKNIAHKYKNYAQRWSYQMPRGMIQKDGSPCHEQLSIYYPRNYYRALKKGKPLKTPQEDIAPAPLQENSNSA